MKKQVRVIDYLNAAEPADVARIYAAAHGTNDGSAIAEAFDSFRRAMNDKIAISHGDGMRAVLTHYQDDSSAHFFVDGEDREGKGWGLMFRPWGEWKILPVEDRSGKNLSTAEIATHLFQEIGWLGSEDDAAMKLADAIDQIEAAERDGSNRRVRPIITSG